MAARWGGGSGPVGFFVTFVVVVALVRVFTVWMGPAPSSDASAPASVAVPVPSETSAGDGTGMALPPLTVSDDTAGGYDRDEFGPAWHDVDRNGCGTRDDVLARDLSDVEFKPGTRGCVVVSGVLDDPYTGRVVEFTKTDASKVQIDHVVPLGYAWAHGADQWDAAARLTFANDPENLLAVDGAANQSKSDSGPSEWLPPDQGYWCAYVGRFAAVASAYGVRVSPADMGAMEAVAAQC